jgi:hypothetical protein
MSNSLNFVEVPTISLHSPASIDDEFQSVKSKKKTPRNPSKQSKSTVQHASVLSELFVSPSPVCKFAEQSPDSFRRCNGHLYGTVYGKNQSYPCKYCSDKVKQSGVPLTEQDLQLIQSRKQSWYENQSKVNAPVVSSAASSVVSIPAISSYPMYEAKDGPVPANVYIAWPKQEDAAYTPAFNPFGSSFRQFYPLFVQRRS